MTAGSNASAPQIRILPCGDAALAVEFGETVDPRLSGLTIALAARLDDARIPGVLARIPTFRSLFVHFDPILVNGEALIARLTEMTDGLGEARATGRLWRLPACYDTELAPDLEEVAARVGLSVPALIEAHSSVTYHVYMLGFLPGFPYIGDMPSALELPRRENPRLKIPAGSVTIAMNLTTIFTFESPSGWHLLARTPVWLWDARRISPALVMAGDKIKFEPIGRDRFADFAERARGGTLSLEPERAQ